MVKAAIGVFEPSLPVAIPLDKWQRQQRHEGKAVGRAAFSDYRWSLWTNCFLLIYAAAALSWLRGCSHHSWPMSYMFFGPQSAVLNLFGFLDALFSTLLLMLLLLHLLMMARDLS